MRPFEFEIRDPARLGRAAAIRSARELDARTREDGKSMTPAERLRTAFALSRTAVQLKGRARGGLRA